MYVGYVRLTHETYIIPDKVSLPRQNKIKFHMHALQSFPFIHSYLSTLNKALPQQNINRRVTPLNSITFTHIA